GVLLLAQHGGGEGLVLCCIRCSRLRGRFPAGPIVGSPASMGVDRLANGIMGCASSRLGAASFDYSHLDWYGGGCLVRAGPYDWGFPGICSEPDLSALAVRRSSLGALAPHGRTSHFLDRTRSPPLDLDSPFRMAATRVAPQLEATHGVPSNLGCASL